MRVAVTALLLIAAAVSAAAPPQSGIRSWAPPLPAFQAGAEIHATADHLDGDFTHQRIRLSGNVNLVSADQQIQADRLEVVLAPQGRHIETLDAQGEVRLVYGAYTAIGDRARFDTAAGRAQLLGHARIWGEAREVRGDSIDVDLERRVLKVMVGRVTLPAAATLPALWVAADTIVADDLAGRADLTGAVEVVAGPRHLWAGTAALELDRKTGALRRLFAGDGIRVEEGERRGRADRGSYDLVKRTLVLEGNADLTEGVTRLRGERIRVNLATRQVEVERGTIEYRQD
ncbi:MAG: LptA/OstA family protein [Nitrospirota bacterium]|jgi:lipopolysaccharide transport protein LptA